MQPQTIPANPSITTIQPLDGSTTKVRRTIQGQDPVIFADIYKDDINMAVWQRQLSPQIQNAAQQLLHTKPTFQAAMALTPQDAKAAMDEILGISADKPDSTGLSNLSKLSKNIAELVDMFCCLFDLEEAGLRLASIDKAMCPNFHVDKLQCRLVTTYHGIATEWLPNELVDRSYLGSAQASHMEIPPSDIQRITVGDVALLKGERWQGNEQAGLVHRSPKPATGERRLLLTLDFIQ